MAREAGDYIDEIVKEQGEPTNWVQANQIVQLAELRLGIDRQRQYGHGNIEKHGEFGIVIRITDKLERLTTMVFGNNPKKALESILELCDEEDFDPADTIRKIKDTAKQAFAGGDVTESIEDSFSDSANYSTYGVMLGRNWWTLPLVEEKKIVEDKMLSDVYKNNGASSITSADRITLRGDSYYNTPG